MLAIISPPSPPPGFSSLRLKGKENAINVTFIFCVWSYTAAETEIIKIVIQADHESHQTDSYTLILFFLPAPHYIS